MGRKKTAGDWRAFLRALAHSGNVRAAAAAAGMDPGTAYDQRIKDNKFAARMDAARAKAKALAAKRPRPLHRPGSGPGRSPSPGNPGEELVLRTTKHGDQLVRAAPGRWNAGVEAVFLAELRRTGCVRWAARACGLSRTALYKRRENYPDFAARWAAAEALAKERIPALLSAAAIASFDPEIEEADLPRVNVDQAIAIARLKCSGAGAGRNAAKEPPIEEVRDEVLRRLAAIRRHRQKGTKPPPLDGEG